MLNNSDWLTRLFYSSPNHDTTLTVILKFVFSMTKNAEAKSHEMYSQARTKARMWNEVGKLS